MPLNSILKREWGILLLLLLMIPLFFLNVKDCHDWGGDFAQYIHQAINISKGISPSQTGYVFNDQYPFAPNCYPNGFPLMLVPIYITAGNSILAFSYFMTALLVLLGIAFFYFLRKSFGNIISIACVLALVYNPWTLRFKMEVLSDIPFTLFLILIILLYNRIRTTSNSIILPISLGLLMAWLILLRSVGFIIPLAILIDQSLISIRKRFNEGKWFFNWKMIVFAFGTAGIVYLIFTKWIFPIDNDAVSFYSSSVSLQEIKLTILRNADYYILQFQRFFQPEVGIYSAIPLIIKSFALSFFIMGFLFSCLRRFGFIEILSCMYFIILLWFPNLTQGIRLIFPLIPIMLYYIVVGLKSINSETKVKPAIFAVIIGLISILQYEPGIQKIIREKDQILQGPQEPEAIEAFKVIEEITPSDAIIAFNKPTVLSLYAGRSSMSNHYSQDIKSLTQKLDEKGINYFLLCIDLPNPVLQEFLLENQKSISLIWKNSRFELFKRQLQD